MTREQRARDAVVRAAIDDWVFAGKQIPRASDSTTYAAFCRACARLAAIQKEKKSGR